MISIFNGIRFWLGYHDYKFVVGSKFVLIFERSPGVHKFTVPIGEANAGFEKPFDLQFAMADQGKRCDFCHGGHLLWNCKKTLAVTVPKEHPFYSVLLEARPSA